MMSKTVCSTCQSPKANLKCGICDCAICKSCTQFLNEEAFAFLEARPKYLAHAIYCNVCYDEKVAPELGVYNEQMERAKDVNVYFKTQSKETRTLKRKEPPVKVADIRDRDEALLRLAFLAAQLNYNGLIDVQLDSKKVIENGYTSSLWSGQGIPTHIDDKHLKPTHRDTN
jgi:hypothetical protein